MMADDTDTVTKAEAALERQTLADFAVEKVLGCDGRFAIALCRDNENTAALIHVSQKPDARLLTPESTKALLGSRIQTNLTNWSGAEYSYYDADNNRLGLEIIRPASEKHILRKTPSENIVIHETAALYSSVVLPFVERESESIGWIDAVCSLAKEKERNRFENQKFIINVDTKWSTHPAMTIENAAEPPEDWKNAPWTRDIYLLAISKDSTLRSLRDLRGSDSIALLESMVKELSDASLKYYGIESNKLRIFFHYQPQYYRLHAHCTHIDMTNPGIECERSHLLTDVIQLLHFKDNWYETATISYKIRKNGKLYSLLFRSETNEE